ncbi:MAG: HD domain-containing phosphohydrolase [Anaerolineaceae bacterium]
MPLLINSHKNGVLSIYSEEVDAFDAEEVKLLTELANDLAFSINVIRLRERKKISEGLLSESKHRIEEIIFRAPIGVIEWNSKLEVEAWNPTAEEMFGFTAEDAVGKHLSFILGDQSQSIIQNVMEKVLKNEGGYFSTDENITKDGETIICTWHNIPLFDNNGKLICVASLVEDETERIHLDRTRATQLQRLDALRRIDLSILGSLDLNLILNIITDECSKKLGVDAVCIYQYDPIQNFLEYKSGIGFTTSGWQRFHVAPGEGLAGQVILSRKLVQINDLSKSDVKYKRFPLLKEEKFVSYVGVPLISKGEIIGVLEVFQRSQLDKKDDWLGFLEMLAGQTAMAIENVNQFEELQQSNMNLALAYDRTLEGWSKTLELRDEEIEGHTLRVAEIAVRLAAELGMKKNDLIQIRRGALLHDIGKIAIPDTILHKPGPLTDEEWVLMKQHPKIAYDLLSPIQYLRPALNIPYMHHEKWDGSGYPLGLKGEQIPLEARIFAVVDVWDALYSDRPYRKAWPEEKVIDYIKEQSGKHFDPIVVEHFIKIIKD